MNAFVRDGAVNRRRRFRNITTRNIQPETNKNRKIDDDGTAIAPRDLAAGTLKSDSGESAVNPSTVSVMRIFYIVGTIQYYCDRFTIVDIHFVLRLKIRRRGSAK